MNRNAIEQALTSLVPTLTGDSGSMPAQLTDLATSLLAQSRYKAPNLRPEEEVARVYACAHLSCERLKRTLALPKIDPRPPCGPRIYQKVIKYFTSILGSAASAASTPVTGTHPVPLAARFGRAGVGRPGRTEQAKAADAKKRDYAGWDSSMPEWVMSASRAVCSALGFRHVATHVFAGVQSVVREARLAAPDGTAQVEDDTIPVLVVAVAVIAIGQFLDDDQDKDENGDDNIVNRQIEAATVALAGLEPVARLGVVSDQAQFAAIVRQTVKTGRKNGWTRMEWFGNLASAEQDDDDDDDEYDDDEDGPETDRDQQWRDRIESGVSPILGAHPAVGWFSLSRQQENAQWQRKMLALIDAKQAQLDQAGRTDGLDVMVDV